MLQFKKAFWFASLSAMIVLTLLNSSISSATMLSCSAGISFCLLLHKMTQTHQHSRPINNSEQKDRDIIFDLEQKTHVLINEINILTSQYHKYTPNAFAVGGFTSNKIYIFQSLLQSPFINNNERKAIYAHEIGHLKHWDFFSDIIVRFCLHMVLMGNAISIFFSGLYFPNIALSVVFMLTANLSSYAIHQINELLADCFAAQYANSEDLMSAQHKLSNYNRLYNSNGHAKKEDSSNKNNIWHIASSFLPSLGLNFNMSTHPSDPKRKSYLESYNKKLQSHSK